MIIIADDNKNLQKSGSPKLKYFLQIRILFENHHYSLTSSFFADLHKPVLIHTNTACVLMTNMLWIEYFGISCNWFIVFAIFWTLSGRFFHSICSICHLLLINLHFLACLFLWFTISTKIHKKMSYHYDKLSFLKFIWR